MTRDRTLRAATGEALPRIGLGCMGMSEFYGPSNDAESLRALHLAYELGYRHFDTADLYGNGQNERLLARFLEELGPARRQTVYLATKVGIRRVPGTPPSIQADSSPEYISRAFEACLERLGVDHVDLLYLHRRTPSVPIEDTVGKLADLVRAGKVRDIGLSEVSAQTLRKACSVFPIAALQSEYSLWTRDLENEALAACEELGVALVPYSPLGRGFLTGKLTPSDIAQPGDLRQALPRFAESNFEKNSAWLEPLRAVAEEVHATMAQVALAWVLSRGPFVYPIPGARRDEHLRANFDAVSVSLSVQQLGRLTAHFEPDAAAGARLPPQLLSAVNV